MSSVTEANTIELGTQGGLIAIGRPDAGGTEGECNGGPPFAKPAKDGAPENSKTKPKGNCDTAIYAVGQILVQTGDMPDRLDGGDS